MIFIGLLAKLKIYLVIAAVAGVALLATFMAGRFYERADINSTAMDTVIANQRKLSKRSLVDKREFDRQVTALNKRLKASEREYEKMANSNQVVRDWENGVVPPDSVRHYWLLR